MRRIAIDFVFDKEAQLFDNINFAGLGAAVLLPLIFFSNPVLVVIGYIASAVAGWNIGSNIGSILSIDEEIKAKVFESGCENFVNSIDKIFDEIETIIISTFSEKLDHTDQMIKKVILYYGNLLEQQEKAHQETQEQIIPFISEKQQQLTQLQNQLQTILSKINQSR
ncbi:MAG: hypothetical protein AAGJ08_29015 [Cyanobacteria bacterium P01_H01_bin.35]